MLVLATALAVLSLVRTRGTFVVDVLPASLLAAAGMALAFIPSLQTAISSARPEEGGLASGIVNPAYQVGCALGLAAVTALATSRGAGQLGDRAALTHGDSAAFLAAAVIAAIGGLLGAITLGRSSRDDQATRQATEVKELATRRAAAPHQEPTTTPTGRLSTPSSPITTIVP